MLWTLSFVGPSVAAEERLTAAEVEATAAQIEQAYHAARQALEELPKERFDRTAVLEAADHQAERLVDWVRENTRWVPYAGILRGAGGVLLDRQGNSLDRSLLLVELLQDAGYDARLVRGQLSEAAAEEWIEEIAATGYEPEPIESLATEEIRAVVRRAAEQAEVLAGMVALQNEPWETGVEEIVADHWWVEARIDSKWVDLDPQLSGELARLRPEAKERFAPGDLPERLFHAVSIKVVIERWQEGELTEETPFEHRFRIADEDYHDFELQFVAFGFEPAPAGSGAGAQITAVADTTEAWVPLLRRGERQVRQRGFGVDGHLEDDPAGKPAIHDRMKAATRALGGLGGREDTPRSSLTAAWIEYSIEVPERSPQLVRREIFDLIGPALRRSGAVASFAMSSAARRERGLALASISRILVTGNDLPPIALSRAALELWARQGPQIAALVRLFADPEAAEPLQRFLREPLIALDLLALAVMRDDLSPHGRAVYHRSPNVLSTHYLPALGDDLDIPRAVDLVLNEVGVVASGSTPASRIRLAQGVLDTALEFAMSSAEGTAGNTFALFSQRGVATGPWRVHGSTEATELSETAQARMAEALAAGLAVVAPESVRKGHDPAWWQIDRATGTTLGVDRRGWGQATSEYGGTTGGGGGGAGGGGYTGRVVACEVLIAYWRLQGFLIMTPEAGVVRLPRELFQKFIESGCKSGRPWLILAM